MKARKKPTRGQKAREKLLAAVEHCAYVRGEANWWNGYRCAGKDSDESYGQEMKRWLLVDPATIRLHKALDAYARAIRQEASRG